MIARLAHSQKRLVRGARRLVVRRPCRERTRMPNGQNTARPAARSSAGASVRQATSVDRQAQRDGRSAVAKLAEIGEVHHAQAADRRHGAADQRLAHAADRFGRRAVPRVEPALEFLLVAGRSETGKNRCRRQTRSTTMKIFVVVKILKCHQSKPGSRASCVSKRQQCRSTRTATRRS